MNPRGQESSAVRRALKSEYSIIIGALIPVIPVFMFFWNLKVEIIELKNIVTQNEISREGRAEYNNIRFAEDRARLSTLETDHKEFSKLIAQIWQKVYDNVNY